MKSFLTFIFVLLFSFTLLGQSNIVKLGPSYRNMNYLLDTEVPIGFLVGYNHDFANGHRIELNFGYHPKFREASRYASVFRNEEKSYVFEAFILFPLFKKWIPSTNLKGGIGYIGSNNKYEYLATGVIRNEELESSSINSLTFQLHELGIILEYDFKITDHFLIFVNSASSVSLNQRPLVERSISEFPSTGGIIATNSTADPLNSPHLRVTLGVGYSF